MSEYIAYAGTRTWKHCDTLEEAQAWLAELEHGGEIYRVVSERRDTMERSATFEPAEGPKGGTPPNQRVTPQNLTELPTGSVVRNGDGSRIIHLHAGYWLWVTGGAWAYYSDPVEMANRLDDASVACHIPPEPR